LIALLIAIEFRFPQFPQHPDRARRWPTNFGLGILNALIASSLPVLTVWSAQLAAEQNIGLLNWTAAPWWLALPATLLVGVWPNMAFMSPRIKTRFCGGCIAYTIAMCISMFPRRCVPIHWT